MKRVAVPPAQKTRLLKAVHDAVCDMFNLMERDNELFSRVLTGMQTLDVLVIVTYVQWSRWPFHRQGVCLESATLRDSEQCARIAEIVSSNLTELLVRDLDETSLEVLCSRLDATTLANAIQRLYMNTFTAKAVMTQMLAEAIRRDLDQAFENAVADRFRHVSGSR